jgi:hypothetical protein
MAVFICFTRFESSASHVLRNKARNVALSEGDMLLRGVLALCRIAFLEAKDFFVSRPGSADERMFRTFGFRAACHSSTIKQLQLIATVRKSVVQASTHFDVMAVILGMRFGV